DAVTIGVDLQVIDGQIIYAGRQNAEVAPVQNREIAQENVPAILEGDGFIADASLFGLGTWSVALAQAPAPDQSRAEDRYIFEILSPNQAVVPMIVAVILIALPPVIRLSRIISAGTDTSARRGRIGRYDFGAGIEQQADVALEMDGIRKVARSGKMHGTTARRRSRIDRLVYGGSVDG